MSQIVLKQNSYINSKMNLSEKELSVLSSFYFFIQKYLEKNYSNITDFSNLPTAFSFTSSMLKKILNITVGNYNIEIEKVLNSILNQEIILNKYPKLKNSIKYNLEKHTHFIVEYDKITKKEDNKIVGYKIKFNEIFIQIAFRKYNLKAKNFTPINIQDEINLKGKHSKRLFNKLTSMKKIKDFSLSLKDINILFMLDQNKSLSVSSKILKRVYPQVNKILPFIYEIHKKDKKISFNIR